LKGRLLLLSQTLPLLTLEPGASTGAIFTATFSAARPLVIAAGGINGTVYIYDLQVPFT
jgi:hypothetical protein